MSKVTSKLQVTIPKRVAERHGIQPGDEVEWVSAGETIRVIPESQPLQGTSLEERLELFDRATERQTERQRGRPLPAATSRGWTREELYDRGRSG
jgi:AbrB family looped-hinge helix DNA binding protein